MSSFSSRGRVSSVVILTLLGLAWTATAAQATETKFQASATFQLVSYQGTHGVFTGQGRASPGGSFTMVVETHANNGNGDETAVATLDFGHGDTLTIYSEDVWLPDIGQRKGSYVITGGTGRFAGASGTGTFIGVPAGDGTGVVSYDGTISK
jgi:hypothetical protein